ncbi:MAG: glutamine-hydrolyzing carbamoyl-phosphate synthase small subunit [Lachnospiraceae bacterium]|nr:glutamine-hydrolyzing carbamoyl-phosphate synthase small subunit [Lachnospiraceae bacterium]
MDNPGKKIKLVLQDGAEFFGFSFGYEGDKLVEVVFNTSMVGYQEILSDPSYTYQAVVMTYPLIGNYGMCEDDYESKKPSMSALIVREICDTPSNFRCVDTLSEVMKKNGIVGMYGVDTRKLARHIREYGSCKAYITDAENDTNTIVNKLKEMKLPTDAVSKVSVQKPYEVFPEMGKKPLFTVVAIDCGMKLNIVRSLVKRGCKVIVVPWDTSSEEILKMAPDGIFISNGPGDPEDAVPTIEAVRQLKGKLPIFGICLGHQIISLAYGAKTYKLKFGHRGGNHPVKNLKTGKIEITSQNHSYAVLDSSVEGTGLCVTHINVLDKTIEGLECEKDRTFSVQYHPESAPGPQDSAYLFDLFISEMKCCKEEKENA